MRELPDFLSAEKSDSSTSADIKDQYIQVVTMAVSTRRLIDSKSNQVTGKEFLFEVVKSFQERKKLHTNEKASFLKF